MRAINDNIVVRQIVETISERIIVPPVFGRKIKLLSKGVVVSAGHGGENMVMPVERGNTVVYGKNAGFDIDLNGEKLRVIKLHNMVCAK